jgi:hypothetical protein
MPDTITRVDFQSRGAPASAKVGTYPILVGRPVLSDPTRRRLYSIRYLPGTMTVQTASPIAFVRKAETWVATPSGGFEWTLPVAPTVGNTLVVFIGAAGSPEAVGYSVPTTGGDVAYDRVGGFGYEARITDASDFRLGAFTHTVASGGSEGVVKVTFADPGHPFQNVTMIALEYSNVDPTGATAFEKAESVGSVRPNPLPALTLDGSNGQAIIFGMVATIGLPGPGSTGPDVPTGFTGRYAMAGATDTTALDINCGDGVGFFGVGPETVSLDWTPGAAARGYAGIVFALTAG